MSSVDTTNQVAYKLPDTLSSDQRRIVTTLDEPLFVAAGAGSGKTLTLTHRIVWALSRGSAQDGGAYLDSIDQALIITYTNKAAGEIKERVRSALRAAGLEQEALKVDSAWISTIHSMCGRILRENAFELGLDPNFVMVPSEEYASLREAAVNDAISELQDAPYLRELFEEYGSAKDDADGFGTSVNKLVNEVLNAAAYTVGGLETLTFFDRTEDFRSGMSELVQAFEDLLSFPCDSSAEYRECKDYLATLRSFVARPRQEQTMQDAQKILDSIPDNRPSFNNWVNFPAGEGGSTSSKRKRNPEAVAAQHAAKSALEQARAMVGYSKVSALQQPLMRLATEVNKRLDALKISQSYLDNADLLQLTARAFREHPEIAERYTHKFKLVMVDEFQDTNSQQVHMIRALSGENACHLTTVGDIQQSIYRFQGADPSVFLDRGQSVDKQNHVLLKANFRSDDAILRFVRATCGTTSIVRNFSDLDPSPKRKDTFKDIDFPRVIVEFLYSSSEAGKLRKHSADTSLCRKVKAMQLADRLAKLRNAGVEPSRMVVLMKSLNKSADYIEALRSYGIESVVTGGSTFAQQPEVLAIKSLLHVLANPKDTDRGLFAVLASPMFALDADDMALLATKNQVYKNKETKESLVVDIPASRSINAGMPLDVELYGSYKGSARLQRARKVIARAQERVGKLGVADIALMCARESGWLARLEKQGESGHAIAANILAAVRHIRELTETQGRDAILASQAFDAWLNNSSEHPMVLSGDKLNAVRFMTAHSSKGLEFDVVAVVDCCDPYISVPSILTYRDGETTKLSLAPKGGATPERPEDAPIPTASSSALEWRQYLEEAYKDDELDEAGRLLYVALTRAKECVILCLEERKTNQGPKPDMATAISDALGITNMACGETEFMYGGVAAGLARRVNVTRLSDGATHTVDTGNTISETMLPAKLCPMNTASVADEIYREWHPEEFEHDSAAQEGDSVRKPAPKRAAESASQPGPEPFYIFDIDAETHVPLSFWKPRNAFFGTFSYSSAKATLKNEMPGVALDDVFELPVPSPISTDELLLADAYPPGEEALANLEPATQEGTETDIKIGFEDEDFDDTEASDPDRATNLGTSFHELARLMVETSLVPSEEQIKRVAAINKVAKQDIKRLTLALKRWETSAIRAEAQGFGRLRAEVAFCCNVDSGFGTKLEGAIDLLATDIANPTTALLIDYKTGDHGRTYAQLRESHEMQARFYAYVLQLQGFKRITCAFVCVELEGKDGQPVVIRYEF